jgi:hypothetical protein
MGAAYRANENVMIWGHPKVRQILSFKI